METLWLPGITNPAQTPGRPRSETRYSKQELYIYLQSAVFMPIHVLEPIINNP